MAGQLNLASVWPSGALSLITWLATSAGLTGTLIAVGYTAYSAHAEFLGMIVHDLTATQYLRVAGGFFLAVTLQYVTLAGDLWGGVATYRTLAVGGLAFVGTVAYIVRRSGLRTRGHPLWDRLPRLRLSIWVLALAVMALSVVKAAYVDLPAAHISGVLLGTITCNKQWNLPGLIERRTTKLWHDMVCSRVVSSPTGCDCQGQVTHRRNLRLGFVIGVSWASLLIAASVVLGIRATRAGSHREEGIGAARAFIMAMAILSAVHIILVPYYYGKVLYPTTFSIGDLAGEDGVTFKGYIMSVGPDAVTIFESTEKAIVSLPRAHIKEIRMVDVGDVVLSRMDTTLAP